MGEHFEVRHWYSKAKFFYPVIEILMLTDPIIGVREGDERQISAWHSYATTSKLFDHLRQTHLVPLFSKTVHERSVSTTARNTQVASAMTAPVRPAIMASPYTGQPRLLKSRIDNGQEFSGIAHSTET